MHTITIGTILLLAQCVIYYLSNKYVKQLDSRRNIKQKEFKKAVYTEMDSSISFTKSKPNQDINQYPRQS
jgi:hypothetical protein